jgi:hypothetical protein
MKTFLIACAAGLALAATPVAAHEIWIERDATGPARIYLGEPAEIAPPGGDPEFAKLKAPKLIGAGGTLTRRADHIELAYAGTADLRLVDDAVFAPWAGEGGKLEGAVFHARAGRRETKAALELELVPVAPDSNTFTAIYKGAPLPGAAITVINPDRWSKALRTEGDGTVTVPAGTKGRYILALSHSVDGPQTLGGKDVAKVYHVSTLTFVAP